MQAGASPLSYTAKISAEDEKILRQAYEVVDGRFQHTKEITENTRTAAGKETQLLLMARKVMHRLNDRQKYDGENKFVLCNFPFIAACNKESNKQQHSTQQGRYK